MQTDSRYEQFSEAQNRQTREVEGLDEYSSETATQEETGKPYLVT